MAGYGMACYDCGSHDCDGCREVEEEQDPNMETLAASPEGMGLEPVTDDDAPLVGWMAMVDRCGGVPEATRVLVGDLRTDECQRERLANLLRWELLPDAEVVE